MARLEIPGCDVRQKGLEIVVTVVDKAMFVGWALAESLRRSRP